MLTIPSTLTSTPQTPQTLSLSEQAYIHQGCLQNLRLDGRTRTNLRPYTITLPASIVLSNGSARVTSGADGATQVLCSVKADLVRPSLAFPNRGVVSVEVECLHNTNNTTNTTNNRARRNLEMETSQILTTLLTGSVHRESLILIPGKYAWRLSIDVLVLACDGSLLDACSLAVHAALNATLLPLVVPIESALQDEEKDGGGGRNIGSGRKAGEEFVMDGDVAHAKPPPGAGDCPLVMTASRISSTTTTTSSTKSHKACWILDATAAEEACATAQVRVAVNRHGKINAVQKVGGGCLEWRRMMEVLPLVTAAVGKVFGSMEEGEDEDMEVEEEDGRKKVEKEEAFLGRALHKFQMAVQRNEGVEVHGGGMLQSPFDFR